MPITPYHLGPVSATGMVLKRYFDIPALLVSGVILDLEPFAVLVFNLDYETHGFLHSFTIGSIAALATALAIYMLKNRIRPVMEFFKLEQDSSFIMILWSSFLGVYSHVAMDSFLYPGMKPFYPSDVNPFYRHLSLKEIRYFCLIMFIVALVAYSVRLIFRWKSENNRAE
jgi:membrane-bound metal-dependent hydrolase YbcI (DUF457 family)